MSVDYLIPPEIRESLDRYARDRVPTGHFLRAVLSNDLFDAVGRADQCNRNFLTEICQYVFNELPDGCWGSREKVAAWTKRGPTP